MNTEENDSPVVQQQDAVWVYAGCTNMIAIKQCCFGESASVITFYPEHANRIIAAIRKAAAEIKQSSNA
jgi:hypothetical protein